MTALEKVKSIVFEKQPDLEKDTIEKLIYLAYYIGRESAAKEVSDMYAAHMKAQTERAKQCRYHNMVAKILDNGNDYIYCSDYAGDMTATFGSDSTDL